jgi:hypothetical protein
MDRAALINFDLALAHCEARLLLQLRQVEPFAIGVPEIDEKLVDYQDELTGLCKRARDGELEQDEFERSMEEVVNAALLAFFLAGAEAETPPFDAMSELEQEKFVALRAMRSLADDIYAGRYSEQVDEEGEVAQDDEVGLLMLENRVNLWLATAAGMYALGMLFLEATQRLAWQYGGTIEHCEDCSRLVGQVHTALSWRLSGYRPQGRSLVCGGWHCKCRLAKTDKPEQGSF